MRIFHLLALTVGLAIALLWLGADPLPSAEAAGSVYYACDCQLGADGNCVAGSDANSGTDPAAPWQTYARARTAFASLSAGDEIRFCRGGAFDLGTGGARWVNASCTAGQPCVVADYTPAWASGDEGRPILTRPTADHAFDLANGGSALAEGGYVFRNLDLRCTGCTSGGWAFFFYNDVNDVTIDSVRMDGFDIGVHLAGSNACATGDAACNGQNDRITIRDVTITHSTSQGILGGANTLLVEDSAFEDNGDGSILDHNIYLSHGDGITVRRNDLYRSSLDAGGSCGGTSLVGHGVMDHLLIEGNYVHEDLGKANQGCWGISITPGYSTGERFGDVVIRGNRVENVGNMAIGTSSCTTCTIENNVIVQQQGFGGVGIAVPDIAPGAGDGAIADVTIRNNSLAITTGTGIRVSAGTGHTIVSNAIRATAATGGWNCFELPLTAGSYLAIDYNLCGFGAGEWANGFGTLPTWQGQGWDAHSRALDPGFASDTLLTPASAASATVDAGHPTLSAPRDLLGNVRSAPPDAGAYEWVSLDKWILLPTVLR